MGSHRDEDQNHAEQHGTGGAHGGHGSYGGSHEEHEGAPEWLISFADNVTLMMGFFVILLATNMGPKGKGDSDAAIMPIEEPPISFLDTAISIRNAFNNPVSIDSTDPEDQLLVQHMLKKFARTADQIGPSGFDRQVRSLKPDKYFTLVAVVPFEQGSEDLSEEGLRVVERAARVLNGIRFVIHVRGHVSVAEAAAEPRHGMQLSFERAHAVAEALAENGMERSQVRLIACADHDRVQGVAYDQPAHHRNERVEIVVTDELLEEYLPDANSQQAVPSP